VIHRVMAGAGREVYHVARASTATHRRLRERVTAIAVATIGVDLICAVLIFLLERGGHETQIKTFGNALFWTSTQLLTVSSNFSNPNSTGGRILDVFIELWAITVIATLTGAVGSFLNKRAEELDDEQIARSAHASVPDRRGVTQGGITDIATASRHDQRE